MAGNTIQNGFALLGKSVLYLLGGIMLLWALIISLFILRDVIPYFSFEPGLGFLQLKTQLIRNWEGLYYPAFYIHIATATAVAFSGLLQFWGGLRRRFPAWHRWAGRLYAGLILGLAAPSGFVMAWFADGGLPGILCFLCLAAGWWFTTFRGWRTILKGDVHAHRRWMIRSYALTSAALLLRFLIAVSIQAGVRRTPEVYAFIAWMSWAPGLALVEVWFWVERLGGLVRSRD